MGSFGRSLKRGQAHSLGLMQTHGQQFRVAMKARRMWCPKCKLVCDSWATMAWSQPNERKIKTLLCARCGTPVESKTLLELPTGTPEKGLWLRPGPGGWEAQAERLKEVAKEAAKNAKVNAEVVAGVEGGDVGGGAAGDGVGDRDR